MESLSSLPKKEVALLNKTTRSSENFWWYRRHARIPDVLYKLWIHIKEQIAVKEAKKLGIPVVKVMVDTNTDPDDIDVRSGARKTNQDHSLCHLGDTG